MSLQQRQLQKHGNTSLMSRVLGLALAPAMYASILAGRALQLPVRAAVFWLQLADALVCDLLAFLTRQPGHKAQVRSLSYSAWMLQGSSRSKVVNTAVSGYTLHWLVFSRGRSFLRAGCCCCCCLVLCQGC
jgi:hypothetical protein